MSCHILCSNLSTWVWGAPSRKECVNLWKKNTLPAVTTPTLFQLLIWRKSFMEWKVEREKHAASTEPSVPLPMWGRAHHCKFDERSQLNNSHNKLHKRKLRERCIFTHLFFTLFFPYSTLGVCSDRGNFKETYSLLVVEVQRYIFPTCGPVWYSNIYSTVCCLTI